MFGRRQPSAAPPCSKRNKTCTPPDDDVIFYGADLSIITEGGQPAMCYVIAGTHTHMRTHFVGKDGRCVKPVINDKVEDTQTNRSQGHFGGNKIDASHGRPLPPIKLSN